MQMQMLKCQSNVRFKVNKAVSITEAKIALRSGCRLEKPSFCQCLLAELLVHCRSSQSSFTCLTVTG